MSDTAAIWKKLNSPRQLFLIAGPCVIENEKLCRTVAASLVKTCQQLGIFYVFKASFDKANRTSGKAFRGPGVEAGLKTLAVRLRIRAKIYRILIRQTKASEPLFQITVPCGITASFGMMTMPSRMK